jgi:hypothetical protein
MDERYLFSAVRYVENNPVRAGLRSVAEEWRWSSAGAHLHGSDDELVKVSPMLELVCDWKSHLQDDTDASVSEEIHRHLRTGVRWVPNDFSSVWSSNYSASCAEESRGQNRSKGIRTRGTCS